MVVLFQFVCIVRSSTLCYEDKTVSSVVRMLFLIVLTPFSMIVKREIENNPC